MLKKMIGDILYMSYKSYPTRCPKCNYKIVYNTKSNGAPYLMCSNSKCTWKEWNVPDSVMDDYECYISDFDLDLIDLFNRMED